MFLLSTRPKIFSTHIPTLRFICLCFSLSCVTVFSNAESYIEPHVEPHLEHYVETHLEPSAGQPKPFLFDSLQEIENTYNGKPFLLSIWSLSCAPCVSELHMLSDIKKEHPELNLVLLSSDSPELASEAQQFLTRFELETMSSWIYGTNEPEKLRYAIDPRWYGEMPRSYFYDRNGKRLAVSGVVPEEKLRSWIASNLKH